MIRLYNPETDLEFAREVLASSGGVFEGWGSTLPDLTIPRTYVIEGQGMVIAEALGGGEYLISSCFLPHARGSIAGKYLALAMRDGFLSTDAIRLWGCADVSNPNGINSLRFFGDTFQVDEHRMANRQDFLIWVLSDKWFAREVSKWEVDIPHKKMIYAILKCSESGWGFKGYCQWGLYQKMGKDIPNISPMNEDFTRFLVGDISVGLDGIW